MKFLASLLILCIVLLSAFAGTVKPLQLAEKANCCARVNKNARCPKAPEKKHQEDSCEEYGCNMLLTCSICGFLAVEPLSLTAALATLTEKTVPIYRYGNSAVYLTKDWKPPKV
ncbi:hypothetical protein [Mucilaginibacter sp. HD30]